MHVSPQITDPHRDRCDNPRDQEIDKMVEKGFGIGILPRLILQRIPYEVEIRPLQEPYFREIGVAMKNRERVTPVTERFFSYLHFMEDTDAER